MFGQIKGFVDKPPALSVLQSPHELLVGLVRTEVDGDGVDLAGLKKKNGRRRTRRRRRKRKSSATTLNARRNYKARR